MEQVGDFLVAEGLALVFLFDDGLDFELDALGGLVSAVGAFEPWGEEVFEFEKPLGRLDVLAACGAADGGFVDAHAVGDFLEGEGLDFVYAFVEELALDVDNGLTDFQDGLLPLLDVADQPFCGVQFFPQVCFFFFFDGLTKLTGFGIAID